MKRAKISFGRVALVIILLFFMTVILFPIVEIFINSFSDGEGVMKRGMSFKNKFVGFTNYIEILKMTRFNIAMKNTVLRTVIGTIIGTVCDVLLAFVLSRKEFRYKKPLTIFFVTAYAIECGLVPRVMLYRKLNLTNNFWVYIIPNALNIMYVMILKVFMEGFPKDNEESAYLDGAGKFRILISIVVPECKTIIASIAIFIASDQWNSWFDNMLYNRHPIELTTYMYEIYKRLCADLIDPNYLETIDFYNPLVIIPPTMRLSMELVFVIVAIVFSIAATKLYVPAVEKIIKSAKKK